MTSGAATYEWRMFDLWYHCMPCYCMDGIGTIVNLMLKKGASVYIKVLTVTPMSHLSGLAPIILSNADFSIR